MTKEVIKHHAANSQERNTDKNVASATRCNIEHDDKEHEEEQSTTKVAFKNNNNQADAPHNKQGQQHFEARNAERSKRTHGDRQGFSIKCKVKRQEERNGNLCKLARLEGECAKRNPEFCAVAILANNNWQKKQYDAENTNGVFVAC